MTLMLSSVGLLLSGTASRTIDLLRFALPLSLDKLCKHIFQAPPTRTGTSRGTPDFGEEARRALPSEVLLCKTCYLTFGTASRT
jgi:hypothetical protein